MTDDSVPPAQATPAHQDSGRGRSGNGNLWVHDLIETPPSELRKRRLRRIALAAGGALVAAALVAVAFVSLHDSRPDVVITDTFKPHDDVLSSYMMDAPAGALPLPSEPATRKLDEDAAAEVTGDWRYLRRYKFTAGYERRWLQEGGTLVTVRIMRFRGAENAAYYLRDILDLSSGDAELRENAVAGIPGGRSIIGTAPVGDTGSTYVTVSAAPAGDVAVFVIVAGGKQAATAAITEGLLATQYALL